MLDRNFIRTEPELVREGSLKKGITPPLEEFMSVDEAWRKLTTELQALQANMNKQSKQIGVFMAQGDKEQAERAKQETKALKEKIAAIEDEERELETRLQQIELSFPNLPHETTPDGKCEEQNVVVREWGEKPSFDFEPKPHWEIGDELGLFDLPRASKISGSGFVVYTGMGARLQRALFNAMIDHQVERNGYREVYPPYIVNSASLTGTGQLPKFEEDLYKVDDDLYLIPTAEVPVTNLFRDEILDASQLTMKMAAFSGCFRREAGAAGKDTRGIQRVHQFDKVELVKYTLPEKSYEEHEALTEDAESVLQALGLHYRVVLLCSGDLGFSNSKCYDLEIWSPGLGKYLEVSSCSNFEDFQSRRAGIRFKRGQGEKPEFVHTLNGSGLATPRLFSALVETYYQPGIGITMPQMLSPYMRCTTISAPGS